MKTYPYSDLKFGVFDTIFLSATLSYLDCVWADFHVST